MSDSRKFFVEIETHVSTCDFTIFQFRKKIIILFYIDFARFFRCEQKMIVELFVSKSFINLLPKP